MVGESHKKIRNTKQGGPVSIRQGGFLEIIIFVLIALLIMKYMGLTVSEVISWFKSFFGGVLR